MSNLTTEQRFVKPVLDTNPVPGHNLVIFRQIKGGGHLFHSLLQPGQKGPTLMERLTLGSSFVAYAVTRDQNLRHKLTIEDLKSADQVGPFSLGLSLSLGVSDPRLLVEGLENDPLRRLMEEVREVMSRVSSRMDWSEIQAPESELEDELLAAPVMDASGRRVPSLDCLQEFAAHLGLHLRTIQISRSFSEEIGEERRVALEEERLRKITQEKQKTALLTKQLEGRVSEYEAWQAKSIGDIQRLGALSDSATANMAKALDQISDKVDTAPALRSVLADLIAMRREIAILTSVGGAGGNGNALPPGTVTALPEAPQDPLASLLSRAFLLLGSLPCERKDRDRLISSILHLVGEIALLDEADATVVEGCAARLREQVRKLMRSVQTSEQRDLLLQLQDPELIRAELAWR